jgi:hypothetical protein
MDMLVDHYPIRSVVESFDSSVPVAIQSVRLLAEAMAGSEVLIAIACTEDESFSPLMFNIGGKQYLVAGTSPDYAASEFMNYLADRVVKKDIALRAIDVRDLIALAVSLGNVHAVLFDMETNEDEESLGEFLAHSSLFIDGLTRKSLSKPAELLEATNGQDYVSIPPTVLSMLSRETSESERQAIVFDYMSRCSKEELSRTIVFMGVDENGSDSTFTTLARGFEARLRWYCNQRSGGIAKEQTFTLINLWTWLASLIEQPHGYFRLDATVIDSDFAQRVITTVDSNQ